MFKKLPSLDTNAALKQLFGDDCKLMTELKSIIINSEIFDTIEQAVIEDMKVNNWTDLKVGILHYIYISIKHTKHYVSLS